MLCGSMVLPRLRQAGFLVCLVSLAAAVPAVAATYYVSTSGSNSNAGTSTAAPLRTINSALGRAKPGDFVFVRAGTYREEVEAKKAGAAGQPIFLSAYPGEVPVIKGSDVVTGWVQHSGSIWKKTGWMSNSQQVFVDFDGGHYQSLQQIGMPSGYYGAWEYPNPVGSGLANMAPGRFYYDQAGRTLYIQLPDNSNPNAHVVEASVRRRVLFMHQPYIYVKGLRFRHSNVSAFAQQGAAIELSSYSTLEQVDVQYMDFAGIGFGYQQSNARVIDSIASNNGSAGVAAVSARNFLVRNVTMYYNNTRNFNVNWHAGGFKAAANAYGMVENCDVGYNKGPGIWFDHTRSGMPNFVRNNYVHDNGRGEGAIFYEVGNNGWFYNNVVARNSIRGVYLSASDASYVYNNTVYGTRERAGIEVAGMPRAGGTLYNNVVANNIISHSTTVYDLYFAAGAGVAGNRSDYNLIYRPGGALFLRQGTGATYSNLAAWTKATGNDANSRSGDPMFVDPNLGAAGFALNAGSPAINWGMNVLWLVGSDYKKTLRPLSGTIDIGAFEK
jgi:parallel beta-helix repeat protein